MSQSSANDEYWIVAANPTYKEGTFTILRQRFSKHGLVHDSAIFEIPKNFKFGSFDYLIEMTDDLMCLDKSYEQLTYTIEKLLLDLNPKHDFRITHQNVPYFFEQLLYRFTWNDAKFPVRQQLKDIFQTLDNARRRTEEQVRVENSMLLDLDREMQNYDPAESYYTKDLSTVIPAKISSTIISTKHLTTVIAVIPQVKLSKWFDKYESYSSFVVPQCTSFIDVPPDSQMNSLFTAVVFRSHVEEFITNAKSDGFIVRTYTHDPQAAKQKLSLAAELKNKREMQFNRNLKSYKASHSESMVNWLHVKALRTYVEAVLRYGVPPSFQAYVLKPNIKKASKILKELESIFEEESHAKVKNTKSDIIFEGEDVKLDLESNELDYPFILLKIKPFVSFVFQ